MRALFWPILLLLLTSCATRYGLVVGGQVPTYTENATGESIFGGPSVEMEEYKNDGGGYHIGISEETRYFLTKIAYFSNSYKDVEYTNAGTTYDTELSESGVKISLAWKISFLQPYVSVTSYNSVYTVDGEESTDQYSAVGYGANMEFQFSPRGFFYFGYGIDSYDNFAVENSVQLDQTLEHGVFQIGLRFNFSERYTKGIF